MGEGGRVSPESELAELQKFLREERTWGRWGPDDELGAVNLITDERRVAAAGLVRSGRAVSLSREFPTFPGSNNPRPAQHFMRRDPVMATDFYGIEYHGQASTHIDALCHVFDEDGQVWNGRRADEVITIEGASFGGIEHWRLGLVTRGVLLDVPRFRGELYVRQKRPVRPEELEEIAKAEGVKLSPGDALVVYSGRDRYDEEQPIVWGGARDEHGAIRRPGLDPSCVRFVRQSDCAVLAWDMMDVMPLPWGGIPWNVHGSIYAFGVALIDNCDLGRLARACAEENRYEFMFILSPLVVVGGTGSPVNPLAVF